METKKEETDKATSELVEVNELRKIQKVGNAVFAGVCAANGWKPGKKITEDDFKKAVASFLGAPADGAPRRKEDKANA